MIFRYSPAVDRRPLEWDELRKRKKNEIVSEMFQNSELTLARSIVIGDIVQSESTIAGFPFELDPKWSVRTHGHLSVNPLGLGRIKLPGRYAPNQRFRLESSTPAATTRSSILFVIVLGQRILRRLSGYDVNTQDSRVAALKIRIRILIKHQLSLAYRPKGVNQNETHRIGLSAFTWNSGDRRMGYCTMF